MWDARKANKRVKIYETTIVADGYGGNTSTIALVSTRWAIMEDMKASSYQSEAGITDFTNTLKIIFKYDVNFIIDPKKHILEYADKLYNIMDVKQDGFKHVQQTVIAKQILGIDS